MAKKIPLSQILANLADPDVQKRMNAAQRVGRRGNREAVRPLIAALSDPEYKVRREAARSLGIISDPWAVEPLIAALGDNTVSVRKTAALALGNIRDSHAVEALCRTLKDRKKTVRENAISALIQIGASAVSGLAQTANAGTIEAQESARDALVLLYQKDRQTITSRILSEPKLTPLERFQALEAIKNARPRGLAGRFSNWLGSVPQFCTDTMRIHRSAGTEDTAEYRGAESVLQFLTLVRAGQRDAAVEDSELLRGSSADNTPQRADELLRGSDFEGVKAPEAKPRSLWQRLFFRKI